MFRTRRVLAVTDFLDLLIRESEASDILLYNDERGEDQKV